MPRRLPRPDDERPAEAVPAGEQVVGGQPDAVERRLPPASSTAARKRGRGRGAGRFAAAGRARAGLRAPARRGPAAGSGRRRGRAWCCGSTCRCRSRRARGAGRSTRGRRHRRATPAPVAPPPMTTTSHGSRRSAARRSMSSRFMRRPAVPPLRPLDRPPPVCPQRGRPVRLHRRLEPPLDRPLGGDLVRRLPVPTASPARYAAPRAVVSVTAGPRHRHAEQVGLELHQQVAAAGPAVHAQLRDRLAGVGPHGVEQVGRLERDRLPGRPGRCGRRSCRG